MTESKVSVDVIKIFFLTRLQTLHTFLAYQFQHHSIEYVRKIVSFLIPKSFQL